MIPYMTQTRHTLNRQVLSNFFPSAPIPTILHHSEFHNNKYSSQYVRWSFPLHFTTNIRFSTSLSPLPTPLPITQSIQSTTQPPSLPTTPPLFPSHSFHFPSLYPKSATEYYPQDFTNALYSLLDNRSKYVSWITSFIQLLFYHFHHHLSTVQPTLPIIWLPSLATTPFLHAAILPIIALNHFSQFFTILTVRYCFSYFYVHTLAIIPMDTTISDPALQILVVPSPRSLS